MNKEKAFDITSAVSRLREGDEKAFSMLYDFFRSKVFFTSKKMNLSTEDAEEIVQEVFLIIWKNRQNLNSELSFNAYLLTILKSLIIKKSKKEARRIAYEVYTLSTQEIESNETETQIEYSEFERISISEIEKLPKTQKEIFKMKNYENLHSGEIAEKLGISKRTVESHIYVATKSIKNKLQKKYLIAIKSLAIGMIYYFF
ncbi:sigma-70 family RNA polymerase sigma factor [Aquiflexum gelatinilyticum]|uniref:sigma-70 family RNA polymerase sigma factor n=1 Tax=Aquiflexum gelatinilyticum TaxID=2961943 RepID=UPI0021670CC1|nr:sigma-70 family RNA polymerase sigma factor [Aquiflexum gelatinilyticum]MCS4435393.1 sigma-70 family RNA polymerase sigma factor [Aquiflexum gelatinilyticum]